VVEYVWPDGAFDGAVKAMAIVPVPGVAVVAETVGAVSCTVAIVELLVGDVAAT
jgi:hypothetical protein